MSKDKVVAHFGQENTHNVYLIFQQSLQTNERKVDFPPTQPILHASSLIDNIIFHNPKNNDKHEVPNDPSSKSIHL